jgi:similar to spore coat protein
MNAILEYLLGLDKLSDQVIATDLLTSSKAGIKMYAVAATEAATPAMKATFIKHLHEAIDTHERIMAYMMEKGFYQPYNMQVQLQMDQTTAQTALNIPS